MPSRDVGRDSIGRRIRSGFFVTTGLALVRLVVIRHDDVVGEHSPPN